MILNVLNVLNVLKFLIRAYYLKKCVINFLIYAYMFLSILTIVYYSENFL